MQKNHSLLLFLLLSTLLFACKSSKEELAADTPDQYVQLQTGKYIIYRVDSTIFTTSGTVMEHRYYQERHLVDSQMTDALGRPSWRIFRAVRDTAGQQPWSSRGTYLATLSGGNLEFFEDNQRIVRLAAPLRTGASWKGNRFLGADPFASLYTFSNDDNMADWDFTVTSTGATENYYGASYPNVLTVDAYDESINLPVTSATTIAIRTLSTSKWARGIGLVYQNYIMWEFNSSSTARAYQGFGVERRILQHN